MADETAAVDAGGADETVTAAQDQAGNGDATTTATETKAADTALDGGDKASDWRAGIDDPKLKDFASKFTTPAEMAKATLEFRQKLSNAVRIPGEGASEEEVAEFRQKLGVPSDAAEYEFAPAEGKEFTDGDKAFHEAMRPALLAAGVTKQGAAVLNEALNAYSAAAQEQVAKAREAASKQALDGLKKEWGGEFETNVEYAKRGAKQFGDDGFTDFVQQATVDGVQLGNHPHFLKVFAEIGRRMGEGGLHQVLNESDKTTTEGKLDELTQKAYDAQRAGNRDEANRLYKERDELSRRFYGTDPVVGSAGRTI